MCFGSKTSSPDTSTQTAESQRQLDVQKQIAADQLAAEHANAVQQAADAERQHQEDLTAQKTEADRQYGASQSQLAAENARAQALEAQQAAERQATEAAATARAGAARDYSTGRQALIDGFTGDVNTAFAPFDDTYYGDYQKDFKNAYTPELDTNFAQQRRDMILAFANNGNLNSTAAARQFGLLEQSKAKAQGELGNKAIDSASTLRNSIDQSKRDSLASLFSSTDIGQTNLPDGVTDASGALGSISTQLNGLRDNAVKTASSIKAPSFGALGDVLSGYNSTVTAPRAPVQQFSRTGGYPYSPGVGGGRAAYMVA